MRRREFIAGLGASVAAPPATRAQEPRIQVIGVLHVGSPGLIWEDWGALREGLKEAGYVEGRNVAIEFRWANSEVGRLPMLANDLVRRQVAVIIAAGGGEAVRAAKAATSTIPIISVSGYDLVKYGFAASLNRPGGNITGITALSGDLVGKQVGLLHELLPHATAFAFLSNGSRVGAYDDTENDVLSAVSTIGLQAFTVRANSVRDYEAAFATLVERQASALVIGDYLDVGINVNKVVSLAAQYKIPVIYPGSEFARAGGLMSYGSNLTPLRKAGIQMIIRILKGAKPAEEPIQRATHFELAVNLQTARALGLTIPETLLATADEVIQ
jgi:putative tryptophan/tyrosine transport system substrate-binding protein